MKIKKARQVLKSFADDTRLRIINLLKREKLTVTELCQVLGKEQSNMSKHLSRLRLTEIVGDKRRGNNVFYFLTKPKNDAHRELLSVITKGLSNIEIFKEDTEKLKQTYKEKCIENKEARNEQVVAD